MKTGDFDYYLPPDFIAQTPTEPRDHSRLMVLDRKLRSIQHHFFFSLVDLLHSGDVLVFNDTRVIPARLNGKKDTGGKLEILLLHQLSPGVWQTLLRPARRAQVGTILKVMDTSLVGSEVDAEVIESQDDGIRVLRFSHDKTLAALGKVPLPPYIHEPLGDPERYQTVYARVDGSAAAPTAGLHFTPGLMEKLRNKGIRCVFVTLHIGLDTFQPVREEDPSQHRIHREFGVVPAQSANELFLAKAEGRRVICVGTTSTRLIEATAKLYTSKHPGSFSGWVDLFIVPGYQFQVTDALITNFHLPRTTLMMLVSAFTGREYVLQAYQEAIKRQYRFYTFGDAMVIF